MNSTTSRASEAKRCVLVLGMHRSGTSATARLISLLGASLPSELIAPDESNPSGYWEPTRINTFNNEMLQEAGSRWDDWRPFDINRLPPDRASYYRAKLREILSEDFGALSLSVLKDPRIARFVPLYASELRAVGVKPAYLLVVRNPISVCASLAVRDGMAIEQSSLLWLRHFVDFEVFTRGDRRCVVTFEAVIDDWRTVAVKIENDLAISWPSRSKETEDIIDGFLSSNKRHHVHAPADLAGNTRVAEIAKAAYLVAAELEGGTESDSAMFKLDSARHALDALADIIDSSVPATTAQGEPDLRGFEKWLNEHHFVSLSEVRSQETRLAAVLDSIDAERRQEEQAKQELQDRIAALEQQIAALEPLRAELAHARAEAAARAASIEEIRASTSWTITTPLRQVKLAFRRVAKGARSGAMPVTRWAWHRLPIAPVQKQNLKRRLVRMAPNLLSTYSSAPLSAGQSITSPEETRPYRDPGASYVPRLTDAPHLEPSTRVVAFYLPQFHPIPENNAWWGDGFTEWTNVAPAKPHFLDHYQPHVPGELGYYDLRDSSVQARQIEMAKLYGIGGFCFYFYWFGGKRLLESPLLNYLNDSSLDFPFMLCWANENWTRRWDGLENELLIQQDHSSDDDIAFIRYVSTYLRDPRYMRINGKPILAIYRPSQLPSAIETSERWRQWCRDNGVGEIYLAYTQSFESVDPAVYGLDGAIEFPPNNSSPSDLTHTVTPLCDDFRSRVYDWSEVARRSESYSPVKYDLFRSVCPGWDNTARRKGNASVFVNNTPLGFSRWLANAISDTERRFDSQSSRLVFVNAWNEWAEGAHLEPDARSGYAYLEAIRVTLERSRVLATASNQSANLPPITAPAAAIVVHAYYPDVLDEILNRISELDSRHRLFVTTDSEHYQEVREALEGTSLKFNLYKMPNRGRDVLPFLKVLRHVREERLDFVVKVHTKKSLHRRDGAEWRRQLYDALLSPDNFERALAAFAADPTLGMVGPDGHFVSMETYIGSNKSHIFSIGERLGLQNREIMDQGFFAGTMFAVRVAALAPLSSLAFTDEAFGEETGQIDGTLAHAMERAFSLSVRASGQRACSNQDLKSAEVSDIPSSAYAFGGESEHLSAR